MLTQEEIKELKFLAYKVGNVHGKDYREYIKINEIIDKLDFFNISNIDLNKLQNLTNNYIIPNGACKAQTRLLILLNKMDKNIKK